MAQELIKTALKNMSEDIKSLDNEMIMEVVGVAQALDELQKAIDKVNICLEKREFSEASSLGYGDVSTAFIFLQRTLGGLQQAEHKKHSLISEFTMQAKLSSYEEAAPFIESMMESTKPRKVDK